MNETEASIQHSAVAWFCLRSQPKHEHIAAARLRAASLEVFLPRIRFKKGSARGPVWVTEALFPNYLFARFDWRESARLVRHAAGVSTIVSFGAHIPTVPDEVIAELRRQIGEKELHVICETLAPEDRVQISGGAFHGLMAVVAQVLPAKERVKVLLNFLGRQTTVEIDQAALVKESPPRQELL
ncbi:MAG TPA: transcription termination/antitermination NusG family protein [Methylomirabilota bacterium]|nr:transcription termination/antitermination NusG family protein [Methylomirabilota bacterium]